MKHTLLKVIAAVALALGLFAGAAMVAPSPAGAHQLPPGQWYQTTDSCTHASVYGNFGNGFAQMKLLSSGCSIYTQVGVITAHDGHTHEVWCSVGAAIFNPTANCTWDGSSGNTTIQATVHGTAIAMATIGCGGPSGCVRKDHWAL